MEILKNDLYSRQIKTFGIEAMKKLIELKVLIIGIRGFGIEISKNLVLLGVKMLGIYDKEIVKLTDLGNNYFLNESHINKCKRDEGCVKGLQELNPYVKVIIENNFIENYSNYDVICITEMIDSKIVNEINQKCRKNKKGFIYTCNLGLIGVIFSDFGENFEILDENGEECTTMCIKYISREKNAFIETDSTYDKKRIRAGNFALFKDVQGMSEINGKIIQLKSHPEIDCFFIGDTSNYKEYIKGGIIQEIKMPIKKSYVSFEQSFKEPKCNNFEIDIDKTNKNNKQMLHCTFMIIQKYFDENHNLPKINDENISEYLANKAKEYYNEKKLKKSVFFKKISKEFNLEKMKNLIKFSKVELPSICSFLGGFIAQEIIKFTGLYNPLDQWAWFDFYDSIKNINLNKNIVRTPINSRYDEQIMVFGREIHEKLTKSNFFLIGAGAVGCEYLKILALMGASTDKNAKIIVTDNDNIETSNLNRQFLFRQKDIGKSKSEIACKAMKKINKNINCEALQIEVSNNNEKIFNSNFWQDQDFILIAVDSLQARKYINTQCVLNEKKFLECGTLGGEASSQIVIPFLTQDYINYGNFMEDSKKENENTLQKLAMCTLKQFPYKKEHCIELGRDNLAEYFVENIKNLKLFLNDKEKFIKENNDLKEKIYVIRNLLKIKIDNSFEKCLEMGIFQFNYNYIEKIQNLLSEKPENFQMKDGTFFWSGSRIRPHPLNFDLNNKFCLTFISTYGILLAQCLNIELVDYQNISLKIQTLYNKGEFRKFYNNSEINIKREINEIIKDKNLEKISDNIYPLVFEIEDDTNHQIDFIYACSNLKSKNFDLGEIPWLKVKLITGRIVPSIPTTSSSVTGFISHQIYPLLVKNIKLETLNVINLDLRIPSFIIQKPFEIENYEDEEKDGLITKVLPKNSNLWSKLKIKGPMTISQFKEYLLNKYGVELEGLYTLDEQPIINNNFSNKIEEAYFNVKKEGIDENPKKIYFLIKGCGKDFDIAKMPYFEYEL